MRQYEYAVTVIRDGRDAYIAFRPTREAAEHVAATFRAVDPGCDTRIETTHERWERLHEPSNEEG